MRTFKLKLSSAMVINGGVVRAGTTVELDEPTAKDFLRRGKAELISAPEPEVVKASEAEEIDLSKMTKPQLAAVAEQLGIEGVDGMTKADLVKAIELHEQETE